MGVWVVLLIVFIVSNSFILLEEEVLVLIASIFWVDAAGGFIRETLTSEIENRGEVIEEKFKWYLETKKKLLELLIQKHEWRQSVGREMKEVYQGYIEGLISGVLDNYLSQVVIGMRYERRIDWLILMSRYWAAYGFIGDMEPVLEAIDEVENKK